MLLNGLVRALLLLMVGSALASCASSKAAEWSSISAQVGAKVAPPTAQK